MTLSPLSTRVVLAGVMLAFGGMTPALSDIVIKSSATTGQVDFAKHNKQQFKTAFRIGLNIDPASLGDDELKKAIESLPLTAPSGLTVKARDYSVEHGFIIGVDDPDLQPAINQVMSRDGRTELLVNFQDGEGRFVLPPDASIGTFTLNGVETPRLVTPFKESSQQVFVDLLLDRSGSMEEVIGDVKRAASEFMALLPFSQALCRITSFNGNYTRHTEGYEPCVPGIHQVGWIKAGGGTDIYQPLLDAYRDGPVDPETMRLVVVVSDGVGRSRVSYDEVMVAKNAATFVYWLGDYDEDRLKGVADTFIHGKDDIANLLGRYFGQVAGAVSNQVVISIGKKGGQP